MVLYLKLIFFIIVWVESVKVYSSPRILCEPSELEIEVICPTNYIRRTLVIKNTGSTPLVIERIIGCCGIELFLHSKAITPGSNTLLDIKLFLSDRTTSFKKAIYIVNNSSEQYYRIPIDCKIKWEKAFSNNDEKIEFVFKEPSFDSNGRRVLIEFFFEPSCYECLRIRREIFPELESRFSGKFILIEYDIFNKTNLIRLLSYQKSLNVNSDVPVCIVVDRRYIVSGYEEIKERLLDIVQKSLQSDHPNKNENEIYLFFKKYNKLIEDKFNLITFWTIINAGFLDGINPCAITTFIFLVSVLTVAGLRRLRLFAFGFSFCIVTYITYFMIGLGILNIFSWFGNLSLFLRQLIDVILFFILIFLSVVSFIDAYRFKIGGNSNVIILQLPDRVKERIRSIIREKIYLQKAFTSLPVIMITGAVVGFSVTVLESICTGQVYLPVLAVIVKDYDIYSLKAILLLIFYNLMFILPLILVVVIGVNLGHDTVARLMLKHLFVVKILFGLFFLFLSIFILFI